MEDRFTRGSFVDYEMDQIIEQAEVRFKTPREQILASGNRPEDVGIRRWIAFVARSKGMSFPRIGRALKRHHTTIINLVQPKKLRRTNA